MSNAEKLIHTFSELGLTFASAESCTAGMITSILCDVPGSSAVVLGGIVSYAVSVKEKILGVSELTIEKYGVVSEQCAKEMAKGASRVTGADISVSVTGIAGPGGGTEETPVGTVCFGLCVFGKEFSRIQHFDSRLTRNEIRKMAAEYAIDLALSVVSEKND